MGVINQIATTNPAAVILFALTMVVNKKASPIFLNLNMFMNPCRRTSVREIVRMNLPELGIRLTHRTPTACVLALR